MKKRSLFAAVAMLIVSAIVLTSATFAWFQANGSVEVAGFNATTTSQGGGLLVSTTGGAGTWKNALTYDDYAAVNSNVLIASGGTFTPVSGSVGADGSVSFIAGSLSGATFSYSGSATQGYIKYTTYVQSPNVAGNIQVAPTMNSDSPFVYYSVVVNQATTNLKHYTAAATGNSTSTYTYNAIANTGETANANAAQDNNPANGIIDDAEKAALTLSSQPAVSPFNASTAQTALTFAAEAGVAYEITVYCWAEGQDSDCVAGAAATSTTIGLDLSLQASGNNG